MQTLSLLYDDVLVAKKQDVVKVASERISLETKKENLKKELIEQDIKVQSEEETKTIDETWEKQKSKCESEKKSQTQSFVRVTSSKSTRSRKSITRAQSSIEFASFEKLKRIRVINSVENSKNKRQREYMITDVKKLKYLSSLNKQRSFRKTSINQIIFTRSSWNDAQSMILQLYCYWHVSFWY